MFINLFSYNIYSNKYLSIYYRNIRGMKKGCDMVFKEDEKVVNNGTIDGSKSMNNASNSTNSASSNIDSTNNANSKTNSVNKNVKKAYERYTLVEKDYLGHNIYFDNRFNFYCWANLVASSIAEMKLKARTRPDLAAKDKYRNEVREESL